MKNIKLLHVISDEKFPDAAYRQFEAVSPGVSTYLLPDTRSTIKYLKEIVPVRVSCFAFMNKKFIKSLDRYDAVILHGMTSFNLELIGRASRSVNFVWIGMGSDYYDILYASESEMLEPYTRTVINNQYTAFSLSLIKRRIKNTLKKILYPSSSKKKELIGRVSIFSPVLQSEYTAVKKSLANFTAEFIRWNYGAQSTLIDNPSKRELVFGHNVLIGNSASPNNNHLEVFHKIKDLNIEIQGDIVVPLSYGDPFYRDYIIKEGLRIFGDKFKPITEFLNYNDYVELLAGCPVVIMNHKRQQGAGNIAVALFLGAKIFMNSESLLYKEYISQNLIVFENKDLELELSGGISGLEIGDAKSNRQFLMDNKGFDVHIDNTRTLINRISDLSCLS